MSSEYEHLLRDMLGYTSVHRHKSLGSNDDVSEVLTNMQTDYDNGWVEILSINVGMLEPTRSGGGHAVVFAGGYYSSKDSNGKTLHHFKVFTWGNEEYPVTVTDFEFRNYYKGSTLGKKPEK